MTATQVERLILIYAADSGTMAAVKDSAKKLFRLKACSLCSITHGVLGEKEEWVDYTAEIGVPIDSYHRDEIPGEVKASATGDLPLILAWWNGRGLVLLGSDELEKCGGSVPELRKALKRSASENGLEIRGIS